MQKRGSKLQQRPRKQKADVNARVERAFEEGTPIDEAVYEGFLEAVRIHKQAGIPMVFWEDGKVVRLSPDDVEAGLNAKNGSSKESAAKSSRRRQKR